MTNKDILLENLDLTLAKPCRNGLHKEAVEKYTQVLKNAECKWIFPPLQVCKINNTTYLLDGQHRYSAAEACSIRVAPCTFVEVKNEAEARRYALCANSRHGEKLTREEMRNNILAYMLHGGAIESDTQIAQAFGVSRDLVRDIRAGVDGATKREKAEIEVAKALQADPNASIRSIAEKTGLNRVTVRNKIEALKEHTGKSSVGIMKDCFGREIPQDIISKYIKIKTAVADASAVLKELTQAIEKLVKVNGFSSTNDVDIIRSNIESIKYILKERKPEALCTCRGDGCKVCGGTGFLAKEIFKTLITE